MQLCINVVLVSWRSQNTVFLAIIRDAHLADMKAMLFSFGKTPLDEMVNTKKPNLDYCS